MNPLKLIISSKGNLTAKYGKGFTKITSLLTKLQKADKKRNITTDIVYLDEAASMKKYGLAALKSLGQKDCKNAVDALYKKVQPAYLMIFGAQDIIPFQELINPAEDDDTVVPSDLPYACNAPYSKNVSSFTGPARVMSRLPDIPGKGDTKYVETLIQHIINHKPLPADDFADYFSVTALVWTKSTQQSLKNIFGNATKLLNSPPNGAAYPAAKLKPRTHFFNCHGARNDSHYYGQKGDDYPIAFNASYLTGKITYPTIVAAECCYGAQILNPNEEPNTLSIASTYLLNHAISFVGSSNIAYGPADGQALADLITQDFIKSLLNGASAGRAFLEARQEFLSKSGPQLDPYELKTLAQFYLLGDASIQPVAPEVDLKATSGNTVENRRLGLASKGDTLSKTIAPSKPRETRQKTKHSKSLLQVLKDAKFGKETTERVYEIKAKSVKGIGAKAMGGDVIFRAFIRKSKAHTWGHLEVLVVKENDGGVLGWRVYERK